MKFIALSAAIATASAALGDDCYYDANLCDADGLKCATWEDSQYGPMASCEDCSDGNKQITDSFGDPVVYECPAVEGEEGNNTTPTPPAGEDAASHIALSAAIILAATTLYV